MHSLNNAQSMYILSLWFASCCVFAINNVPGTNKTTNGFTILTAPYTTVHPAGIVGPAIQGGCIIRCVGNLADEKF
jgi:hypothetical protein